MLKHRVIPVVLLDGYSVLKTIQFKTRRNLGNPITVARIYNTRNIDELILLDIDASKQQRQIDYFTIEDVASECFMPLTVGGGLSSCSHIENVLKRGADKVAINTAALKDPSFIREASAHFGAQCIVVSVDVIQSDGCYKICSHSLGTVERELLDWCKQIEGLGAGEIFLNSVDRDGMMNGYDTELIRQVSSVIKIPLISCGGAGKSADLASAIQSGASASAAASLFHFTKYTPEECRASMRAAGLPARTTARKSA
ncbi:MAG: imidazole glycerol phosphate synthase cyclase subunit [Candidatus Omnitrophota bacterium]